tara:strand:- start:7171 stop:8550 length:1380 start_codon:yes stop_codon:yes gene_type:complete
VDAANDAMKRVSELLKTLTRSLRTPAVTQSGIAFVLRVTSAGLSFLMFVALARAMTPSAYGEFGFTFSLATFISLVSGLGLGMLALRFIPVYASEGDHAASRGLLRSSYVAISTVTLIAAAALVVLAVLSIVPWYVGTAGLLVIGMTFADFQAGVFRAKGTLILAQAPRDVAWRLIVILLCAPAMLGLEAIPLGDGISVDLAVVLCGVSLIAVVMVQLCLRPDILRDLFGRQRATYALKRWTSTSWGLWLNGILQPGAAQIAVVLLGIALTPAESGSLFAAVKTATLLSFFLAASNLVAAPKIARMWHEGRAKSLERYCASITLLAAVPTIAMYCLYIAFGPWILSLFGGEYADSYPLLLIVGAGQVVSALSGQTAILMSMTGNERRLLLFVAVSNAIPLALIIPGVWLFGEVFAASALALGMATWNIVTAFWTRRNLGVDTSILGALKALRHRGELES